EAHVNPSPSPESASDWMTRVVTWRSSPLELWMSCGPAGSSSRTYPDFCRREEDGTLVPSSGQWMNSGILRAGECSTRNMCEHTATLAPSHSDGAVCSLSDILETGAVPQRFYLSARACRGILRRAEK